MGYIVRYGEPGQCERRFAQRKRSRWGWSLCILAAVAAMLLFWPEAVDRVRSLLIPGDDVKTVLAFQHLVENMRIGEGLEASVTAFCEEVIYGTK